MSELFCGGRGAGVKGGGVEERGEVRLLEAASICRNTHTHTQTTSGRVNGSERISISQSVSQSLHIDSSSLRKFRSS